MFLMGDEVRRTQHGNNNAYCHDNELSWFDWDDVEAHADMHRFTRGLIAFHRAHALFHDEGFWADVEEGEPARLIWHGIELYQPDWTSTTRTLAFSLHDEVQGEHLHVMMNAYWEAFDFELPPLLHGGQWARVVDTRAPFPRRHRGAGQGAHRRQLQLSGGAPLDGGAHRALARRAPALRLCPVTSAVPDHLTGVSHDCIT